MQNAKEIKQEIRKLKKLKLQCRAGTQERITLHRQIKELQNQLVNSQEINIDKEKLIKEIEILEPDFPFELIDLNKYTAEQLIFHINKVKQRKLK